MKILQHNVETGEVIERDATAEEIAQAEMDALNNENRLIAEAAKITTAASAVAKLEAIGLTAEEIAALRG